MSYELLEKKYMDTIIYGQAGDMGKNVNYLMKVSVDAVITNSVPELWDELKNETKKFEAMYNLLEIESSEDKRKVYYYSAIRTLIELQNMLNQKCQELSLQREYRSYKYVYPILQSLAEYNMISQGELAEKLGISKNALSRFINRTQKYGLWTVKCHGKHKYYVMTAKGKSAYKDYLLTEPYQDKDNITEMIIFFVGLLTKEMEKVEPCIDNVIYEMSKKYGKGVSIFSSGMLKRKLNLMFRKREVGMRRKWRRIQENGNFWENDYQREDMLYDEGLEDYEMMAWE